MLAFIALGHLCMAACLANFLFLEATGFGLLGGKLWPLGQVRPLPVHHRFASPIVLNVLVWQLLCQDSAFG